MLEKILGPDFRPRAGPVAITALAFVLLFGLGTWQLQRLVWKTRLIETIETRVHADPVPLPATAIDPDEWVFRRVRVTGRFLHDREIHLLARKPGNQLGYDIFTPLVRDSGTAVLVNRGWVPASAKEPQKRAAGQIDGVVTVTGVVRKPWPKPWFAPDNNMQTNVWFTPDIDAIAQVVGVPLAGVFIEADATPNPGGLPVGGQTRLELRNDHLQYAITWYLLAIAVVVIFVVYHRSPRDEEREAG